MDATAHQAHQVFMRSLDLPTDDEVYALLVDDRGRVLHRWEGSITPLAGVELAKLASHGVAEAQS